MITGKGLLDKGKHALGHRSAVTDATGTTVYDFAFDKPEAREYNSFQIPNLKSQTLGR